MAYLLKELYSWKMSLAIYVDMAQGKVHLILDNHQSVSGD